MLAALRSSAIDQSAQKYGSAMQATNANLAARGENGMTPISGVSANGYGNLQAAKAGDLADANRTVTLNDAQTANANRLNAASILNGVASSYGGNVGVYGSGASGALNNVTQAQSNGFLSQFAKGLGSGLGGGVASAGMGGAGTALSHLGNGEWGF